MIREATLVGSGRAQYRRFADSFLGPGSSPPRIKRGVARAGHPDCASLHPGYGTLFLLDRDALLADVDVDAAGLLALLLELIAEHDDGDDQRAEDQVEDAIAGHESPSYSELSA